MVAQDDRPVGGRDHEEAHREQQEQRRREPGARRATELAPRQVDRYVFGSSDAPIHPAEHEEQQTQDQERGREQQQRRRKEHERVDRARAGLGFRSAPELDEREDPDRQHDQLDRDAGEQGTVLPRRRASLLEHGSRDVGERQQEQDQGAEGRRDGTEDLRGRVQLHGEQHAGERRSVRTTGEAREAETDQEADRERDRGREDGLDRLREQQRPAREPSAVQHRQLERLTGEGERAHTREHRQGHGADLEYDQQDRDAQVGDTLIHDRSRVSVR